MFYDKLWYGTHPLKRVLQPLSWVYIVITQIRRWYLTRFCQSVCSVPIIVIGNITTGGVGKTPLVIEIAKRLQEKGLKVGIVSRGYGAQVKTFPYVIQLDDCAKKVGDEPLLLAQKTCCPVVIAPKRSEAVRYLLEKYQIQIILSDDGLQHYKMGRDIEILVIDGVRGLGNGLCLPAGPLRESPKRLQQVDFIVVNEGVWEQAYPMTLKPGNLIQLSTNEEVNFNVFNEEVAAVAGIGHPQRFYATLFQLGIKYKAYSYPDHYQFTANDLHYSEPLIIMTEKDAVKCRAFHSDNMYYLPVRAELSDAFWEALWSHQRLQGYC
jgi:tetraacyldisaccharide 4'-kinase